MHLLGQLHLLPNKHRLTAFAAAINHLHFLCSYPSSNSEILANSYSTSSLGDEVSISPEKTNRMWQRLQSLQAKVKEMHNSMPNESDASPFYQTVRYHNQATPYLCSQNATISLRLGLF